MEEEDELEALDPLTIGDLIILKATPFNSYDGYLCGSKAEKNLSAHIAQKVTPSRDSLEYDNYVFRLCPALNYRHSHEMLARSKVKHKTEAQREAAEASMSILQQRTDTEVANNAKILKSLAETGTVNGNSHIKHLVRYGDFIMLQHVKSGYFLATFESAAEKDAECRSVKLVEKDNPLGLLRFLPRFKAHTEGSIVHFSHTLNIESVKQRGIYIHVSPVPIHEIADPNDPLLVKCLQTTHKFEVNLSPQFTPFTVTKYGRYTTEDVGLLRTSDPFRLYHSQTESFMHASCDPEKDRRYPQGRIEKDRRFPEAEGRTVPYPSHIPYLKKLPDLGNAPDPTDPLHHYPKGVWCFEQTRRRTSGTVGWDATFRLRHVPSGRYLAIDSSEPVHEETGGLAESWYGTCLVDDASLPGEEVAIFDDAGNEIGFKAVPESWLEFMMLSAELQSNEQVPHSEMNIRLCHIYQTNQIQSNQRDRVNNTLLSSENVLSLDNKETSQQQQQQQQQKDDEKEGMSLVKKYLYLHCTDDRKPLKKLSKSSSNSNSMQQDIELLNKKKSNQSQLSSRKQRIIASSLSLVFSTVQSAQDIFKLLPITIEELNITNHLSSFKAPIASYTQLISNKNYIGQPTRDRVNNIIKLSLSLIELLIKGQFGFNDHGSSGSSSGSSGNSGGDWINKANSMLPASFSRLFNGEPDLLVQKICRDIKLIDYYFEMGFAPYIRYTEKLPKQQQQSNDKNNSKNNKSSSLHDLFIHKNPWSTNKDGSIANEMIGPQAIQKFVHIVLQRMCTSNIENQNYFGKNIMSPIIPLYNKNKINGSCYGHIACFTDTFYILCGCNGAALIFAILVASFPNALKKTASASR